MELGQIIDAAWQLPWYKLLILAAVDDVMLFLKLWWLWCSIVVLVALIPLSTLVIRVYKKIKERRLSQCA